MGNILQRFQNRYNKDVRILMVGLDASGKTTVLYNLKLGEVITTVPTIGFNVENVKYNGSTFVTWDVSGRDKIRPLWRHYIQDTDVLIFVVDSNDHERISECKDELWKLLREDKLNNVVVLVMANKQDLPNAMPAEEISKELELEKMRHQMIHVQGTCAINGDGLQESLSWVHTTLARRALKKSTAKPI